MPDDHAASNTQSTATNAIAYWIVIPSVIGILIFGLIIIGFPMIAPAQSLEGAKLVLTSLLPVLATWVGTILAYFYSKQNFEAANERVAEMTRHLTSADKLKSIFVKDVMIAKQNMFRRYKDADFGTTLYKLVADLESENKGQRVPILDGQERPVCVIHRSLIDKYLAQVAQKHEPPAAPNPAGQPAPAPPPDPNTITLGAFYEKFKEDLQVSFAVVKETATLAEAKDAMTATSQIGWCQDVFVTKTGTKNEEVLGWVTNRIIEDNSKL